MSISTFELFKIGIGPSSSHTVGPMRAARRYTLRLKQLKLLLETHRIKVELFGSLGATGKGHGSDKAVLLGLVGEEPDSTDIEQIETRLADIRNSKQLSLSGQHSIGFNETSDLILHKRKTLPYHPNGMQFSAFDDSGLLLDTQNYYSIGGGFIVDEAELEINKIPQDIKQVPYPFTTGDELLALCKSTGFSISKLMLENEKTWIPEDQIKKSLLTIWQVMQECVTRGCHTEGILPGGMKVKRRAAGLYRKLKAESERGASPLSAMDWTNLYALAVNEENAAGGRVVTAPTNGAAGIIPAVLHYYLRFCEGADDESVVRFLLTAGAIGILYKINASISGAEVGCQGEVGSACSMAAGGLTEALGGTPEQVENAAEIGMEHNLGLTCDPVGGLVQVPCIERNAMAAVKAINASRMALYGDGNHFVSLDKVIKTMRETGLDMKTKYKETARGGLAVNIVDC
ncbi:L-serine ammonia-lyase [Sedimenticola selenatireducens]|uniref:L-serine dehydratase n=1 Tax=Sedimenticola selenatireducens TaxID=191960 RepID=A0A557S844_9GAMM|nr:L-serine ammonia-lyase [Sedimenticola selenatireducens]TVO73602.1 L-serine ammonia-lyase [Sedimenticola selenatireducens]TVT63542.1 MAG: L-serine ammonia-lyase [Sedimenticola selenatireducens]